MGAVERYPHTQNKKFRDWSNEEYIQCIAVDPGLVNFAFRIERRYHTGRIITIAFWKKEFKKDRYTKLIQELDKYQEEYERTHIVMIEKQPPRSVAINRIMQHTLTYFMLKMKDMPLLPEIIEIDPHVKGYELEAPPDVNLKKWASGKARSLLEIRKDYVALDVLDSWLDKAIPKGQRKDDDLSDTVVMIEAYCKKKGHPLTKKRPIMKIEN